MPSISDSVYDLSDSWIVGVRPARNAVDPYRPYAHLIEKERSIDGCIEDVATVFLTNKECPLRCLMCDLWKNTTESPVPPGAVPTQIRWALERLRRTRHIKLYNSGSFFDPQAIAPADYSQIAEIVSSFDTVVVESHPRMVGRRCWDFGRMVRGALHVAMGLETVHPKVLPRLNKRMTLKDFEQAVHALKDHGMEARAFILLRPPFMSESEGVLWAKRSIDFAFDTGVECCVVIPTRGGNGAMEVLAERGDFARPTADSLACVLDYGVSLGRGRVFADLWDIDKLLTCDRCKVARTERLDRTNLTQAVQPRVRCDRCHGRRRGGAAGHPPAGPPRRIGMGWRLV